MTSVGNSNPYLTWRSEWPSNEHSLYLDCSLLSPSHQRWCLVNGIIERRTRLSRNLVGVATRIGASRHIAGRVRSQPAQPSEPLSSGSCLARQQRSGDGRDGMTAIARRRRGPESRGACSTSGHVARRRYPGTRTRRLVAVERVVRLGSRITLTPSEEKTLPSLA